MIKYYMVTYYKKGRKKKECSDFLIKYYSKLWEENRDVSFSPEIKKIELIEEEDGIEKIIKTKTNEK